MISNTDIYYINIIKLSQYVNPTSAVVCGTRQRLENHMSHIWSFRREKITFLVQWGGIVLYLFIEDLCIYNYKHDAFSIVM